jgi:transposase
MLAVIHQADDGNRLDFRCRQCGHSENADVNAAKNILQDAKAGKGK